MRWQRYFPSGLQRASLQSFSGPPAKGLTILQDKPGVRQIGLAKDDIIVALDGYRTESLFQYQAVRALKDDRSIDLIVWSVGRGQYVSAKGAFYERRFGSTMTDYVKP